MPKVLWRGLSESFSHALNPTRILVLFLDFKEKKKGGHDYRLEACLTLEEFRKIILSCVLLRNNFDILTKYDRSADMPTDLPSHPP